MMLNLLRMGASAVSISALSSFVIFLCLQRWIELSIGKLRSDGLISEQPVNVENADRTLELLLGSDVTISLLACFSFNVFVLMNLCLKTVFFGPLYPTEVRKFLERLVNYIIYKGTFLPLIVPPTKLQGLLWLAWLSILCSLKLFQALAKDRLDRINASPAAKPSAYLRVFSVLPIVLVINIAWMGFCVSIYRSLGSYVFLLLFFEPFSILFETMQAIMVHGFQMLDIWFHHSTEASGAADFSSSATGSLMEWKGVLIRNVGFAFDALTLVTALAHYLHIWWFRGMAFHLIDVVLFLNIRALLSAMMKRVRAFARLRRALTALHGALPDATADELRAYDDECAICREAMARAKRLSCNHLFHLSCLRSWLDQGSSEVYTCPTCRKPLFVNRRVEGGTPSIVRHGPLQMAMRRLASAVDGGGGGWGFLLGNRRTTTAAARRGVEDDVFAMLDVVREVLPHIPDELILQDLQHTLSPTVTVNNFLLQQ